MMKSILYLLLLFSSFAYAGNGDWFEKGNGGFAILCDQKPPQTLDLYESGFQYKWTLDRKYESDVQKRVQYLISKVSKFNPKRASLYQEWAESFIQESEFIPNLGFGALPDLGNAIYDATCKLQQVIYQRQPDEFTKARYTVNSTLWQALSPLDQAGLIMHELIYREFALPPNSHANSEYSRHFNAWLNSQEFNEASLQEYVKTLQLLNVIKAEYKGFPILLNLKDSSDRLWRRLPLIDVDSDGYPLPPDTPRGEKFELFIADSSEAIEILPSKFLGTKCDNPAQTLKTVGMLSIDKKGHLRGISRTSLPFGYETCRGYYMGPHMKYTLIGDFWSFDQDQNLTEVTIDFEENRPSADFDFYHDILFSTEHFTFKSKSSKMPLSVDIKLSGPGENLVSAIFIGGACRDNGEVFLKRETLDDPTVRWSLQDLDAEMKKLPRCK